MIEGGPDMEDDQGCQREGAPDVNCEEGIGQRPVGCDQRGEIEEPIDMDGRAEGRFPLPRPVSGALECAAPGSGMANPH